MHSRIINLGTKIGYPINQKGTCVGLACMLAQAFLLENEEEKTSGLEDFDRRVRYITSQSDKAIIDTLKNAEQERLKQVSLTPNEHLALELPAFYEGIVLYQAPFKYKHLYPKGERAFVQIPEPSLKLAMSSSLAEQGGVASVKKFTGIYNRDEMMRYFDSLRKYALIYRVRIALLMNVRNHTITVGFDPKEDRYFLLDSNFLPDIKVKYDNVFEIAKDVRHSLSINQKTTIKRNEYLVIGTTVLASSSNSQKATQACNAWMNDSDMENMQRVTLEKSQIVDKLGNTWRKQARREGDVAVHREIGKKQSFFHKYKKRMLLGAVIGLLVGFGAALFLFSFGGASILTAALVGAGVFLLGAPTPSVLKKMGRSYDRQTTKEIHAMRNIKTTTSKNISIKIPNNKPESVYVYPPLFPSHKNNIESAEAKQSSNLTTRLLPVLQ